MLYLEDYLEMIEHLPQELRDRFTEMREMDLQVQNAMDSLDERVKQFFSNARRQKPEPGDYERLRQDYYKALEDADEKVQIANQIYDLVDRYLRRLDTELQKFKMELEADNAGITEILERRSLELDKPQPATNNVKGEKRKSPNQSVTAGPAEKRPASEKVLNAIAAEVVREAPSLTRSGPNVQASVSMQTATNAAATVAIAASSAAEKSTVLAQTPFSYNLGSNAIAAAASQAIAATQQMQQGRRTASLKASYEAINSGFPSLSREFTLGSREIGSLTSVVNASTTSTGSETNKQSRSKKQTSRASQQASVVQQMPVPVPDVPATVCDDSEDSSIVDENGQALDWTYDPNEPRYCICNQVSYGDMVACDNEDCPFEWFHYACVGITQPPKGKWFCPQCTSAMKRRGRK